MFLRASVFVQAGSSPHQTADLRSGFRVKFDVNVDYRAGALQQGWVVFLHVHHLKMWTKIWVFTPETSV